METALRHTDHKCETISDCSYSDKTLVEKRMFPDVDKIDKKSDPFLPEPSAEIEEPRTEKEKDEEEQLEQALRLSLEGFGNSLTIFCFILLN